MRSLSSTVSAAKSVRKPASVTFGPRSYEPLSRSELLSWLRSDWQRAADSRRINLIVLHVSDTRPNQHYSIKQLQRDHAKRGFGNYPGYHFYLSRDGTLHYCRPLSLKGCHVSGYNSHSIGICCEGGHRQEAPYPSERGYAEWKAAGLGLTEDNRTAEQKVTLHELLITLHEMFPHAKICGHHDLNPAKACPCMDPPAGVEYAYIFGNENP